MGYAAAGLAVAGAATSAYAQYRKGQSDAAVARNNAVLAGYQRDYALQNGSMEAGDILAEGRDANAQARVGYAENGIDPSSGSAADVMAGSAGRAGVDAMRAKRKAVMEAWGLGNEARDFRTQAKLDESAGILGAVGAGLSGAGTAATIYSKR
jgi:hypothetical protein